MEFADKNLTCKDCQTPFVFTAGEQEFFAARQFTDPVRCKGCRDRRKAAKEANGGQGHQQGGNGGQGRPVVVETRRGGGGRHGGGGRRRGWADDSEP